MVDATEKEKKRECKVWLSTKSITDHYLKYCTPSTITENKLSDLKTSELQFKVFKGSK